jgi:hypothetical protein
MQSVGEYFHKIEVTRSWIHVDAHHTDHILIVANHKPCTGSLAPCNQGTGGKLFLQRVILNKQRKYQRYLQKFNFQFSLFELGDKV